MSVIVVGLTGGFGCGKSTVAEILGQLPGVLAVDTDKLAKGIMASADFRPTLESILGENALLPNGGLNRGFIARSVFSDSELKDRLEQAIHPKVRRAVENIISHAAAKGNITMVVVESAIMFETGLAQRCDTTVCVVCNPRVQRQRLKERRGFSDREIDERLAQQLPLTDKVIRSRHVIFNDGDKEDLPALAQKLYRNIVREQGAKP